MIRDDKYQSALRAVNSILIRARWIAHESNNPRLAELLDAAEILPTYLAQSEDATEEFRAVVEDISEQFEECSHIIEEFNENCACAR